MFDVMLTVSLHFLGFVPLSDATPHLRAFFHVICVLYVYTSRQRTLYPLLPALTLDQTRRSIALYCAERAKMSRAA